MHDLLLKEILVGKTLTKAIGLADRFVSDAIVGICNEALDLVLGSAVIDALGKDLDLLALVAPWAQDLARGLHFRGRDGRPELPRQSCSPCSSPNSKTRSNSNALLRPSTCPLR